jgi:hypothetical protein
MDFFARFKSDSHEKNSMIFGVQRSASTHVEVMLNPLVQVKIGVVSRFHPL